MLQKLNSKVLEKIAGGMENDKNYVGYTLILNCDISGTSLKRGDYLIILEQEEQSYYFRDRYDNLTESLSLSFKVEEMNGETRWLSIYNFDLDSFYI